MSDVGNNPRRIACALCFDGVVFNNTLTSAESASFNCSAFHDFLLMLNIAIAGTPTDILFEIQFSEDDTNWFTFMNGPFGDLRYEDAAGDKTESISSRCLGKYIRLTAVATGTAANDTFTVTAHLLISK